MTPPPSFTPHPPDAAGVVTWVHIGDLHMTRAGERNHQDLLAIVDELNHAFSPSVSFVFLPGDIADDGSAAAYRVVRGAIDPLQIPWCSIVGDHDVHEKSFDNYLAAMAAETYYSFRVGDIHFIALNAFDQPHPASFAVLPAQLAWLRQQLDNIAKPGFAVLLLHCYPTDLKQGSEQLRDLLSSHSVRLIDMGHTHYNEVANDGRTLYTATRSTGQIEEGPAGFSVTNLDGAVVSWKFFPIGELPAVIITSPADERFITNPGLPGHIANRAIRIRAKAWSGNTVRSAVATLAGISVNLNRIANSQVWEAHLPGADLKAGIYPLTVTVKDESGATSSDEIRIVLGESAYHPAARLPRDQDNAIPAWPERGLLGTQLGPNKNGRKW
jgi:predicted phosphodiesterase